jgi:hypothetical protein
MALGNVRASIKVTMSQYPSDDAGRRLVVRTLIGGLFGITGFAYQSWAADLFGGRPAKLPPGRSIYRITGKVLVNGDAADAQTRITAGDTIETSAGAELVFAVGSSAHLVREKSHIAFEADAGGSEHVAGMSVVQGKILSVFGDARSKLTTPTAAIHQTSGGSYIEAQADQTYFCNCYGASDIAAVQDPHSAQSVVSRHHDKPLYILANAKAGDSIRAAPFINHTDQELTLIEALVGRLPPFTFPSSRYNAPRSSGQYP